MERFEDQEGIDMLKKSKYAFFIKKDSRYYIVYSSLTGTVVVFDEDMFINKLIRIIENETIEDDLDEEVISVLKSKKILIDENTNEDILVRTIYEENIVRSTSVIELMLIVTKQCNFRCIYCGQPHENRRMSWQVYESIIMFIKTEIPKYSYKKIKVTFFGGEPLLEYDNIVCFLSKIKELSAEVQIEYEAGMSTNGYLLTPQKYDLLESLNCNSFQISIDGMDYTHDKTRPLVDGGCTWQRIIDNIKYMTTTDRYFSVTLRTNFNIDVAESMIELYDYIQCNLNDKRIHIYYETIKDQGNKDTPRILSAVEGMMLNIDLTRIVRERDLDCINTTIRTKPCSMICYASKPNFYIIDEDGALKKCSYDLNVPDNYIGELKADGTTEIDFERYGKWVYSDYLSLKACKKCKALPLCLGKRCPRNLAVPDKKMQCNTDIIENEIEGMIKAYY